MYSYKKLLFILLMALSYSACDKKEDTVIDKFDRSLLLNKKWYLTGSLLNENGNISSTTTIDSCVADNRILFQSNNHLVCYYGQIKCNAAEPDTLQKWWHVINGQLDMDNTLYDVLYLSTDSMSLKKELFFGIGMTGSLEHYYKN
jgi:hypothetical protein